MMMQDDTPKRPPMSQDESAAHEAKEGKRGDKLAMTLEEFTEIHREIEDQPPWRKNADKEMDYADGNQLDSELIQKQRSLGIPPAIEDLIGPAMLSIQGYEATTRTDWRVTAAGGTGGQDVADAINSRLNEAERESKADRACSDAFRPQAAIGLGWVEVSRDSDPFKFPYRCTAVNRNEISWDMQATSPDLEDARWLRRHKWIRPERIALMFPKHKDLIDGLGVHGSALWTESAMGLLDGGTSTGLRNAWTDGRGWSVEESRWYNAQNKELCLSEVWYRRWVSVPVLKSPDGRVVEFDDDNQAHLLALMTGASKMSRAVVSRVRRAYWLGPHCLDDSPSPYPHAKFPYVPFWGFKEDRTGVPYGYVRGMIYQQDAINSGTGKLRWGMSAVSLVYTEGSTDMTDAQLGTAIGRVDSRIKLNSQGMAKPGARFDVSRDYQLTSQHFQMLQDNRAAIERVSSVTSGFQGKQGTATSGLQEQTQVEQSNQSLARLMSNFRDARSAVGDLLTSMIVEDMGKEEQTIIIEGDAVREDRSIVINRTELDEHGMPYLSNDLQRTRLKVALEDVPSTSSFRGQQLNALSEAIKSLPEQYKVAVMPFLMSLLDVPFKADLVKAIRDVEQQQTPEQIQEQIKQAVQDALVKAGHDLKARDLDIKERKTDAEISAIVAQAVQTGVQSAFSAFQAANQVVMQPAVAPVADAIMQGAGYKRPNPLGDDPNFPIAAMPAGTMPPAAPMPGVNQNTSPQFPPVPSQGASPMTGIETASPSDNFQGAPA